MEYNLAVARAWSSEIEHGGGGPVASSTLPRTDNEKIVIGYLSNNFRNHPLAQLVGGLIALHNRDTFRIHCYSYGENDSSTYRKRIEEQIAKCNAKIRFIESKSHNLRQYCLLELQKAEFFSNAKEILLIEMIENEIATKNYKIQYFLNSRFYKAVLLSQK